MEQLSLKGIISSEGKVMKQEQHQSNACQVDIIGYPAGLNLIEIISRKEISRHKVIKMGIIDSPSLK